MSKNKKISIILPVYNSAKYLEKCLNSVINQTYGDFELIVVNDGSTDSSQQIIDEFTTKDDRIKSFIIKNHGQSYARNYALKYVTGNFITFIDSDDYYSKDFLKIMIKNITKYRADVVVCNFYKVNNGNKNVFYKKENEIIEFDSDLLDVLFRQKYFQTHMWNKLYKAKLFENVRFPEDRIYEDLYVNFNIFKKSKKIVFDSTPLYNYVYNSDSSLNQGFSVKKLDFLYVCSEIQNDLEKDGLKTEGICQLRRYLYICTCNLLAHQNVDEFKTEFNDMRRFIRKNLGKIVLDKYKLKYKLAAIFLALFPNVYIKMGKM